MSTSNNHQLDRREEKREHKYYQSRAWETSTAISSILDIAMKPIHVLQQLEEILDVLTNIPWLDIENKGAIFATNSQRELVLITEHGLDKQLLSLCAKVPFGRCHCGRAAETAEMGFSSRVDQDHEIRFDGMADHGHYCLPLKDNGMQVIGMIVLYLKVGHEPNSEETKLMATLGRTVSGIMLNRNLQLKTEVNRIRLQHAQQDILHKLVVASEFKDNETGEHIKRVSLYSAAIGKGLGMGEGQLQLLEQAAPLHDIGKIGIPDNVLLKPGRLNDEELAVMQQHTTIGADIMTGTHPLIVASRQVALNHHEKWDGSGYPQGLQGETIPLVGRICALADVFDALTSERPYKQAWPLADALAEIDRCSGTHFDPQVVAAFRDSLPEILEIKQLYSNDQNTPHGHLPEHGLQAGDIPGWTDSMSVGVMHIDKQHMYLVNLINQAREAVEQFRTRRLVKTLLDMKTYAEIHFVDEEELMRRHGFPGLDGHILIHRAFMQKADDFLNELEAAPLATTTEITSYLSEWLIKHICGVDAQYGRFIKEQSEMAGRPMSEAPLQTTE